MTDRTAAERQRRARLRSKAGACFAPVDVPYDVVLRLIDEGMIAERDTQSPRKLGDAVSRFLEQHAVVSAAASA